MLRLMIGDRSLGFFFVVQNSQRRSIRAIHSGETCMSTVRRPSAHRAYIREASKQTTILRLQGTFYPLLLPVSIAVVLTALYLHRLPLLRYHRARRRIYSHARVRTFLVYISHAIPHRRYVSRGRSGHVLSRSLCAHSKAALIEEDRVGVLWDGGRN